LRYQNPPSRNHCHVVWSHDLAFYFQRVYAISNTVKLISTHFGHPSQFPYRYFYRNAVQLHSILEFKCLTTASPRSYCASEKCLRQQ
jgi:hypothetical protein